MLKPSLYASFSSSVPWIKGYCGINQRAEPHSCSFRNLWYLLISVKLQSDLLLWPWILPTHKRHFVQKVSDISFSSRSFLAVSLQPEIKSLQLDQLCIHSSSSSTLSIYWWVWADYFKTSVWSFHLVFLTEKKNLRETNDFGYLWIFFNLNVGSIKFSVQVNYKCCYNIIKSYYYFKRTAWRQWI